MNKEEYIAALEVKLNEEVAEYQQDKNLEEMADILEVLQAICVARGYSLEELEVMRAKKASERGGFVTGIVVVAFVCLTGLLCVFVRRRRRIVQQHRNTIRERYMQLTTEYNKVVEELNQSRLGWEEFQKNKKQELEKLRLRNWCALW